MTDLNFEIIENPENVEWSELYTLVHKAYALMDNRIDPPSSLLQMDEETFRQKARDETLLICLAGDVLAGCMFCRNEGDWLYVGKVAVDSAVKGQGIARRMFDHAFKLARRGKFHGLELETRVELEENHRIFEKLGFVKFAETAHAGYSKPTAITMRAEI